jgi:hypothetical protein
MRTRQGVARPALTQHTQQDNYEQDAERRAALHAELWEAEPLSSWQQFILHNQVRRSRP